MKRYLFVRESKFIRNSSRRLISDMNKLKVLFPMLVGGDSIFINLASYPG